MLLVFIAWLLVANRVPASENFALERNVVTASILAVLFMVPVVRFMWQAGRLLTATLAAYPLSRYHMRFKRPFLYIILFATGLPITAIMVPVYGVFVQLNLLDSMTATTLFLAATTLPFAIWLMKNFMDGVPIGLEEAAWTDGASAMQALWRIIVPLVLPGAAVVGIFTFIATWGNFFIPFILLTSPSKMPASVTIYQFFTQYGEVAYGPLAAFSIIFTIPVIVLYVIIQRTLGGAFNLAGATKG